MQIQIGKVIKPQGIKGELKVLPLSLPDYLKSVELVTINNQPTKIETCSIRDGYAYIKINNCKDRNTAETLRNAIIYAEQESLPDLETGQYFYDDIVGCDVYLDNGELVGQIMDIENYGTADIFTIKQGLNQIACPFVEGVFLNIDTKLKKIIADKKRFAEVTDYED